MNISLWGQCWEEASKPTRVGYGHLSFFFLDENTGWTSGTNHLGDTNFIAKTIDAGVTWDYKYFPDPFSQDLELSRCCTKLFFVNEEVGYGGFNLAHFHRTEDGGNSWEAKTIDPEGNTYGYRIDDIDFVTPDTGWVLTEHFGDIYHTTNGGDTWELQFSDGYAKSDIEFLDTQHGWMAVGGNSSGQLRYTLNGGNTWLLKMRNLESAFIGVQFLSDSIGFAMTKQDFIYRTRDGGSSWDTIEYSTPFLEAPFLIKEFEFVNDTVGWAISYFKKEIIFTQDGGNTWHLPSSPNVPGYRTIQMLSPTNGWAVTDNYLLIQYQPKPFCEALSHVYRIEIETNHTNEGTLLTWEDPYACVDGYRVTLKTQFFEEEQIVFADEDVGHANSYLYPHPWPADSTYIIAYVTPYNYAFGEGDECMGSTEIWAFCDSLPAPPIDTFICEGEAFYWDGHLFESPGVYQIPYFTQIGCDSTITLNLQWYEPPAQTLVDTTLVEGALFEGNEYGQDTIFTAFYPAANGCDSIVTYVINIVTNLSEPDEGIAWSLYPNPSTEGSISLVGKYEWTNASLFDVQGQLIRTWDGDHTIGLHTLDVTNIPDGVYWLKVQGDVPTVLKLVIL